MSELKTVYLRQGKGKDQIYMAMGLNEETINEMVEIRRKNPRIWDDRDLELLSMACRRLELKRHNK